MGKRLTGFDYSRPLFYMVTIKCRAGRQSLSEIVAPGKCQLNAITRAMVNCIRHFHEGCKAIAPIECFSIMPDHIHLLIRIIDRSKTLSGAEDCGGQGATSFALMRLEAIVSLLMQALCAKGRMLFLSLWEPAAAKPDNATLYKRCHEMGDILLGATRLGKSKTTRAEGDSPTSFALNTP